MKATLLVFPRAESEMLALSPRDFNRVVEVLEFLTDYLLAAQAADLPDAPDVRRAVAGQYLIYYRYDPLRPGILVYSVRHGRQKPPEADEILPE